MKEGIKFIKTQTFKLALIALLCFYMYALFGTNTEQTANSFGITVLIFPLVVIAYWTYQKIRQRN